MPPNQNRHDYLKLHGIILLWGFTAILGKLIDLPSLEVVLIRSGLAAFALAVILRRCLVIDRPLAIRLLANGVLIGIHWVTFFASVKVANVSICMVGLATISLWTALLEPLLIRHRKIRWDEFVFGGLIVVAVYWIFRGDAFRNNPALPAGLFLALVSAFTAALFSIFNGKFVNQADYRVIVGYEMAGACAFCAISMVASVATGLSNASVYHLPTSVDWLWLLILSMICTVYAYSEYVELLKRLSVFTINFANNLEPLYGILLGAIIFHDHQQVDTRFYAGFTFIAMIVAFQPWFNRTRARRRMRSLDGEE